MRLADDPNAKLGHVEDTVGGSKHTFETVRFTCPACGEPDIVLVRFVRDREAFRLDEDTFVWKATGEFPSTLTLTPSVDVKEYKGGPSHYHGHVENGVAK